jgi:hypothetical protein
LHAGPKPGECNREFVVEQDFAGCWVFVILSVPAAIGELRFSKPCLFWWGFLIDIHYAPSTFSAHPPLFNLSTKALMSEARQALVILESFTGFGNRPSDTPAYQAALEIGKIPGNPRLWSPTMSFTR